MHIDQALASKGHEATAPPKLPSCPTNLSENFVTLFATNVCHKYGKTRSIVLTHSQNGGAARDCNNQLSTLSSNYCPHPTLIGVVLLRT